MSKFLGFYRPFGYRKNVYFVITTSKPNLYLEKIASYEDELSQIDDFGFLDRWASNTVIYKKPISNNKGAFSNLIDKLQKDGNSVTFGKTHRFPQVEFSKDNHHPEYIAEIGKFIERCE